MAGEVKRTEEFLWGAACMVPAEAYGVLYTGVDVATALIKGEDVKESLKTGIERTAAMMKAADEFGRRNARDLTILTGWASKLPGWMH